MERKGASVFVPIGLVLIMLGISLAAVPHEETPRGIGATGRLFRAIPASLGQAASLAVTNSTDAVNGDTSSPDALVADPGSDGVSLREAMLAAASATNPLSITFDRSLKGSKISVSDMLPRISGGNLKIMGDIDADGKPDITVDGGKKANEGFYIQSSDIRIEGFIIKDFTSIGINIAANSEDGVQRIGRVTLLGNTITVKGEAIRIATYGRDRKIENVDVLQSRLLNNYFAINISAGFGSQPNSNNRIANITIRKNAIANNFIAINAEGAHEPGSKNNALSDLEISDNTIQGHPDTSINLGGGFGPAVEGNRIDHLFIMNNTIENLGGGCGIEIGNGGEDSTDNHVSDVAIEGNVIKVKEAILVFGSDGGQNNSVEDLLVNRNTILGGVYQGVHVEGGGSGARNSSVEKVKVTNNLIARKGGAGILLSGGSGNAALNVVKDITILNNTLASNGSQADWAAGIRIENNSNSTGNVVSGVKIANTILWKNRQNDSIVGPQKPASVWNCILGDARYRGKNGSFYGSPQFVNQAKNDYRLLTSSPAIDKGAANGVDPGKFDLAGYLRTEDGNGDGAAVTDIGAYERQKAGVRFHKLTIASDTHGRVDLGSGVFYLPAGTKITLRALPKEGCAFRKWSGSVSSGQNLLTVTMNGTKTINANFRIIVATTQAAKTR